jgi:predicted aspartyl protease
VAVTVVGPTGTVTRDALLDTGADDTVFPEDVARRVGLDLSMAVAGSAAGAAMHSVPVRYAKVALRIADRFEQREWQAWVGFTSARLRQPLIGFAGFLQFFTTSFHGDAEAVELSVNSLYSGT